MPDKAIMPDNIVYGVGDPAGSSMDHESDLESGLAVSKIFS